MTKFHHITLFFLFYPLSLAINLPLTIELSPSPPVSSPYSAPEPVPPNSASSQPPTPTSIIRTGTSSNTSDVNYFDCFKVSPFAPARPLYNDCQAAIRLLPIDTTPSRFQYVKKPTPTIPNPTLTNSQKKYWHTFRRIPTPPLRRVRNLPLDDRPRPHRHQLRGNRVLGRHQTGCGSTKSALCAIWESEGILWGYDDVGRTRVDKDCFAIYRGG